MPKKVSFNPQEWLQSNFRSLIDRITCQIEVTNKLHIYWLRITNQQIRLLYFLDLDRHRSEVYLITISGTPSLGLFDYHYHYHYHHYQNNNQRIGL